VAVGPGVALDGGIDQVGIGGVHANGGDMPAVGKSDPAPALATVVASIDAVAVRGRDAADRRLAGADIDDLGIGRGQSNRADGSGREVAVGYILPALPGVDALPQPAA